MKVIDNVAVWGDPIDEGALKQAGADIRDPYKD